MGACFSAFHVRPEPWAAHLPCRNAYDQQRCAFPWAQHCAFTIRIINIPVILPLSREWLLACFSKTATQACRILWKARGTIASPSSLAPTTTIRLTIRFTIMIMGMGVVEVILVVVVVAAIELRPGLVVFAGVSMPCSSG